MDLKELTEKEIAQLMQDAIETQDGRLYKKLKNEMNRREKFDY